MREYVLAATAITIAAMLFVTSGFGSVQALKCGQGNTTKNNKICTIQKPTETAFYNNLPSGDVYANNYFGVGPAQYTNTSSYQDMIAGEMNTDSYWLGKNVTKITIAMVGYDESSIRTDAIVQAGIFNNTGSLVSGFSTVDYNNIPKVPFGASNWHVPWSYQNFTGSHVMKPGEWIGFWIPSSNATSASSISVIYAAGGNYTDVYSAGEIREFNPQYNPSNYDSACCDLGATIYATSP